MEDKEPLLSPMNKREREILARLATGLSDQQIADELLRQWQALWPLSPAERMQRIDLIRRELGQPIDADCLLVVPMEAKQ